MRVRKLIVNTFIREIVLFEDRIVITYNFKNNTDTGRHTPETVEKMLNEVDSAYTTEIGSSISLYSEPITEKVEHKVRLFSVIRPLRWSYQSFFERYGSTYGAAPVIWSFCVAIADRSENSLFCGENFV